MPVKIYMLLLLFLVTLTASAYEYNGPETELILLINEEREASDAPPLILDWELTRLARLRTEEMRTHKLFDHESLVFGSPSALLDHFRISYSLAGANIAMGQETPHEVLEAWKKSDLHYSNLVNQSFTNVGLGISWDDEGISYWTLLFINAQESP